MLASDKSNSIKLNFTKNNIDITANTPEVGEAKESLPVAYKGREFSIAFNPEFLMAPLRNLAEDEVFLDLIDEMSPGVIKIQTPVPLRPDADAHQFVDSPSASTTSDTSIPAIVRLGEREHAHLRIRGRPDRRIGRTEKEQAGVPTAAARCEMPLS